MCFELCCKSKARSSHIETLVRVLTIVGSAFATNILVNQSRFRKFEQDDKWSFCLTTAIVAVNRRNHEQTTPPEPLTGLQGEGGPGRRQGRSHNRPAGRAFRRSPQSDHSMEIAA